MSWQDRIAAKIQGRQVSEGEKRLRRLQDRANEDHLADLLTRAGLGDFLREHRFCDRKWRLDFAWPERRVAIELQGGGRRGRHLRMPGYRKDREKINAAQIMGWRVLEFTTQDLRDPDRLVSTVRRCFT